MKPFIPVALLLTALSTIANAEENSTSERWFQVEVMIFENPTMQTDNPESWPTFPELDQPAKYIKLQGTQEILTSNSETENIDSAPAETSNGVIVITPDDTGSALKPFTALSEFERQLNDLQEKLSNSRGYKVLFHEAWNQPVPGRNSVIPIRIDGGERFGRQSELQGYINLYVERYLHLSTDLYLIDYEKSEDPFSIINEGNQTPLNAQMLNDFGGLSLLNADLLTNNQISRKSDQFYVSVRSAHLQEKRRMRSKEIHYLDNPLFGLLVLITPIEIQ